MHFQQYAHPQKNADLHIHAHLFEIYDQQKHAHFYKDAHVFDDMQMVYQTLSSYKINFIHVGVSISQLFIHNYSDLQDKPYHRFCHEANMFSFNFYQSTVLILESLQIFSLFLLLQIPVASLKTANIQFNCNYVSECKSWYLYLHIIHLAVILNCDELLMQLFNLNTD
ncbi:Hypothetical_protein [Hexamita inflata]|uniref:Hypothetical_protein n=1 Tax=Hexamita inflata TaxID=28002 RepID=A0AA86THY8_9EUKA|nr:Hypothetical protein HINF_LOCUS4067 [Hexamita inflata]